MVVFAVVFERALRVGFDSYPVCGYAHLDAVVAADLVDGS